MSLTNHTKNKLSHLIKRFGGQSTIKPRTLSVEVTNYCNLHCPFCLVGLQDEIDSTKHDLLPREFGYLDFDLFKKVVDDSVNFGIKRLQLHFQGEPLLHRRFAEMVKTANQAGLYTQVFTNGLLINEKLAESIIDASLDMMRFSVDGATEETYQKNRVGGKFAKVYDNMRMTVEKARQKNSPIKLEWQFIALRNNEHEIEQARKLAEEIGIDFFVKTFAETDPELAPVNQKYRRKLHFKPCTDIYRAIFMYWNGEVVPCCYDLAGRNIVGDMKNQSLDEIWNSLKYIDFRNRVSKVRHLPPKSEPDICRTCLKWTISK